MVANILIVDDDVEFGTALSKILKGEEYDTCIAPSANEGLKVLKARKFDLVFLDLSMPGISGIDFLENIRKDNPTLPVIIITAFGEWDAYAEAAEKGAYSFVNKPVKKEEILQLVRDALRQDKEGK